MGGQYPYPTRYLPSLATNFGHFAAVGWWCSQTFRAAAVDPRQNGCLFHATAAAPIQISDLSRAMYRPATPAHCWTAHPPSLFLAVHLRNLSLTFWLCFSHIHFILCLYMCFNIYIFMFGLHNYFLMIWMMDGYMCVDWCIVGVVGLWKLFDFIWKCFNHILYLRICLFLRGVFVEIFARISWVISTYPFLSFLFYDEGRDKYDMSCILNLQWYVFEKFVFNPICS